MRCKPSRTPVSSPSKTVCVSIGPRLNAAEFVEPPDTMAAAAAMWPLHPDPSVKILMSSMHVSIHWAASSLLLDMWEVASGCQEGGWRVSLIVSTFFGLRANT